MSATLHRKLGRDLLRLRGQVLTIALVIAGGISCFVAMRGNYATLQRAQDLFYARRRLADVFVQLEQAPLALRADLELLPGVSRVDVRVSEPAIVPLPQAPEPIRARVLSLPADTPSALNQLELREGRRPEPDHADEAVLLDSFARAQRIGVGDRVPVILNARRRELLVVGLAMSPEFVIAMPPGGMTPDADRFAVIWMNPQALQTAFRLEGAFNDASFALQAGSSAAALVAEVDRALERYGGLGAYPRRRQASYQMVSQELGQLRSMSVILPIFFLGVAILLVNVVLSRLVLLQQSEIATMKAVGYSDLQVGWHFLELVLAIGLIGAALGVGVGAWLGAAMTQLYERYFKFPDLRFHLSVLDALTAVAVTLLFSAAGAFSAVRRVVRLPPAEAMRPPAPARYRRSLLDRLGLGRALGPSAQMVIRELERRPLRALFSVIAIALATGLTVIGGWYYDGVEALMQTQFHDVMREDLQVSLLHPRPLRATRELAQLPGVLGAEGLRVVPVRFRAGHRERDGVIWGYSDAAEMRRLREVHGHEVELPPDGIVLTDALARVLGVNIGERVAIDVKEGDRRRGAARVSGLVNEAFGLQGHMRADVLARLLGEEPRVNLIVLRTDPGLEPTLNERLKLLPGIAEATYRRGVLQRFRAQSGDMILVTALILSLFAATITIGVVYNNARVALSMRGRDLASLRVLGLTRAEVSAHPPR